MSPEEQYNGYLTKAAEAARNRNTAGAALMAATIGGAVLERGFDVHLVSGNLPGTLIAVGVTSYLSIRTMNQHDKSNANSDAADECAQKVYGAAVEDGIQPPDWAMPAK